MSIWETLGELIGKALKAITDAVFGTIGWRPDRLTDVDEQLVSESLSEDMFKTEEFKKLVPQLKEKLKHSPMDIPDWLDTVLSVPSGLLIEPAFSMMSGIKVEEIPDEAKTIFKGLALLVDYAVLTGILDNVATAVSGTLLRKVGDFADRIIAASGVSQMMAYGMGTAIGPAVAPKLIYAINKQIQPFRLDAQAVITAWRRDPATYQKYFEDLTEQGWDEDRIEALKFYTQAFPALADVVRFYAREVFEPDMIERYGLKDELPPYPGTLFEKLGVPKEIADMYWMAHWEHASWIQVIEMLRRAQLTEDEVREWFRVVEIPPYWRDKLIHISYAVPTRVDVRRWWDMRTIDEDRLREIYAWQGYHGKDLDDYVLWTKVYVAFPDLIARFKNGWITEADVSNELLALGMPDARVKEMLETKFKKMAPAQVEDERKATATEIMKGVKKGYITDTEGIEMLEDLGYSEETARFKLTVYGAIEAGSPEGYTEFKQLSQLYRKAVGLEATLLSPELMEADRTLREVEAEFKRAEGEGIKGEKLIPYQKAKDDAAYRYRQLLIRWKETQKKR